MILMRSILAIILVLAPMTGDSLIGRVVAAATNLACPCGCKTICNCCCRNSGNSPAAPVSDSEHSSHQRCACKGGWPWSPLPPMKTAWRPQSDALSIFPISFDALPAQPNGSLIGGYTLHGGRPPPQPPLVGIVILVI